jgi:hypothetical protein
MFFYVYFDPAIITVALDGDPLGLACLIGIIRGFESNCFFAEFDDWYVQTELKDHVKKLNDKLQTINGQKEPEIANGVKRLKSLLYTMAKRNLFICCLTSKGEPPSERVTAVLAQGQDAELDLVFAAEMKGNPNPGRLPIATLQNYSASDFEARRSQMASNGMLFAPEQLGERDFLNKTLRKALKHCSAIHVYDNVMGNKWGDNYEYTIRTFLYWLEEFVAEPDKLHLHLYCGKPPGNLDHHMKGQLMSFRRKRLKTMPITLHFHDTLAGTDDLLRIPTQGGHQSDVRPDGVPIQNGHCSEGIRTGFRRISDSF